MQVRKHCNCSRRHGAAVVEMVFVMPLLLGLMIGIWELGRIVQVQQILTGSARDGARLAAQAKIINLTGAYTQIDLNSSSPNVETTIKEYLKANGITDLTGLTITFEFLNDNLTVDSTISQPHQGTKNKKFRVRVTLPYANVRWTSLSLINPNTITGECIGQMMVDDAFTLNATMPGWSPPP